MANIDNITVFESLIKHIVHNIIDLYNPDWNDITIHSIANKFSN